MRDKKLIEWNQVDLFVKVGLMNKLANKLLLSSGVSQGSILGSLIFNLLFNRLLVSLPADNYIAYADDVTLVTNGSTSSEAIQLMQLFLNCISNWSASYCLSINTNKCFSMLISPYVRKKAVFNNPLIIGTSVLPIVDKLKILSVQFFSD